MDRWRHQKWADIRTNCNLSCDTFLPEFLLKRIVEKAHLCSSLERLKIVAAGWPYIDSYSDELLRYMRTALEGFNEIFNDRRRRRAEEGESGDSEASNDDDSLSADAQYLRDHTSKDVLKLLCRDRLLKVSGNKPDLLKRLLEFHTLYVDCSDDSYLVDAVL